MVESHRVGVRDVVGAELLGRALPIWREAGVVDDDDIDLRGPGGVGNRRQRDLQVAGAPARWNDD